MKVFTKMMGVMMVLLLSFTLVLGQSSNLEKLKVNQVATNLIVDTYDGVTPVANPNDAASKVNYASTNPAKLVLWDNGPLVTHPGGGFGGFDASVLQSVSGPALTTYGFGAQQTAGNSMADDFTVTGTWTLNTIKFFSYQTGSTTTSTITGIYVQIWNGAPNAGGTVVWGDLTTNRLSSTAWASMYRSIETDFLASNRPIMEVVANVAGCVLSAGTYWVQYQFTGSLASGPWAPPISIWDTGLTGNALQYTSTGWATAVSGTAPNTYAQGMPFIVDGTSGGMPDNDLAVTAILAPSTGANLGSAEPVTIRIQNVGNNAQSNFPVYYTINGGAQVNGTVTATINSLATYDYTFPTTANLSAYGVYNFHACVNLAGDANPANNCFDKVVENLMPSYCEASTTTEDEYIANVSCGTINNPSGWQGGVADYTAISTTIDAGMSEAITVLNGPNIYASDMVTCWVDWNMDYTFGTGDEQFVLTNVGGSGATFTGAIAVPAGTPSGDYRMRVRMTYSTAPVPCGSASYGEIEDYTINVGGSTNPNIVFEDNFDTYTAGGQLACQNPTDWTTWTNAPCGAEDAYISNLYSHSSPNSAVIAPNNDLVKLFGPYTSGKYSISFYTYIPTGKTGYFNTLQAFGTTNVWGLEVYFNAAGAGSINAGGTGTATFTWSPNTWFFVEHIIDMDMDMSEIWIGGNMVYSYQWSLGATGTGQNTLAANDFFGATANDQMYFDDYKIEFIPNTTPLDPPTGLTGVVVNNNDVLLNWIAPGGGGAGGWIQWDAGVNNGNGIGLTAGGTFYTASHWLPADLAAYDGGYLEKISFFPYGDPAATFNLYVWTGPNAGTQVLSQAVASYVVDSWNEITLTTPVMIDASQELWFGYSVTHGGGTFPAGTDDGPAVGGKGDMISLDGTSWVAMGATYGLDYNWNIAGYVVPSDNGGAGPLKPMVKSTITPSNSTLVSAEQSGQGGNFSIAFNTSASKALLGYNVYRDTNPIAYVTVTTYTDMDLAEGTYDYYVTAVYDEGESDPSNEVTVTIAGATYCDATTLNEDEYISNVLCGTINNSSGWQGGVADYTAISTTIAAGESEDITITNPVPYPSDQVTCWVDWNMDYEFDGGDEQFVLTNVGGTGASFTGAIAVPAGTAEGDYRMRVRLTWNVAPMPCGESNYGEVEDYTINVGGGGSNIVFCDDFSTYTVGQQLALQNPVDWTTWSNAPGTAEDPYIVDNGGNVVEITGTNDCVHPIADFTSGHYSVNFDMYIPAGNDGYFNVLQDFAGASSQWGTQVYFGFELAGQGSIDGGAQNAAQFTFDYDTWMTIMVDIDLDNDYAEFYVDGNLIHGWVWSSGTFGTGTLNQLGGVNFYAWAAGVNASPLYHFDNYCLLNEGGTPPPPPPAPTNLVGPASVFAGEDIELSWDAPGSGEYIQWDAGVNNGNGIGLTSGGTFSCASHWAPSDLTPYDGYTLSKVQFFPYGDPAATFVIKVWTGAAGTTLVSTQTVTSYNVDEWNEVVLTTPVLINATTDLWFGYDVTHGAGTFPAGTDDGPAVGGKGDMISTGTGWVAMGATYGLDYNWNLAGFVALADGKATPLKPIAEISGTVNPNASFSFVDGNGIAKKMNPSESKDLVGFNVYRKNPGSTTFNVIGYTTETNYTDNVTITGLYQYYVTAVYEDPTGESLPSNTITVDVMTGIEDVIFNNTAIYPNPANDMVNIKSEFEIESIRIFNHAGQAVASEIVDSKFYQFNTSQFTPGLYLFQIETNEGTITKRIIIE
jgi:hypothetical protein